MFKHAAIIFGLLLAASSAHAQDEGDKPSACQFILPAPLATMPLIALGEKLVNAHPMGKDLPGYKLEFWANADRRAYAILIRMPGQAVCVIFSQAIHITLPDNDKEKHL